MVPHLLWKGVKLLWVNIHTPWLKLKLARFLVSYVGLAERLIPVFRSVSEALPGRLVVLKQSRGRVRPTLTLYKTFWFRRRQLQSMFLYRTFMTPPLPSRRLPGYPTR